jgi:hypothetical protein
MWNLFSHPAFLYVLVSLIGLFFTYLGGRIYGFLTKKDYQEAVKYCVDKLAQDDDFIKDAGQIVAKSYKMNNKTAKKITDLPTVQNLTKQYVETHGVNPDGGKTLTAEWLEMELRDMIVQEWNVDVTENMLIKKLKPFKTDFRVK